MVGEVLRCGFLLLFSVPGFVEAMEVLDLLRLDAMLEKRLGICVMGIMWAAPHAARIENDDWGCKGDGRWPAGNDRAANDHTKKLCT